MPRFGRLVGRLLLAGAVLLALFFLLPREQVLRSGAITGELANPERLLAMREGAVEDLVPGTEARIAWAGDADARTELVILNLHGFSASSEEIRPVPDRVAAALGANLIFARLPGHGRDAEAMAEPRAGDWVDDMALMLAIARSIGDRVVIIGTSTGGTLAAFAASEPDLAADLAGIVFISPNFRLASPVGALLELPFVRLWAPWIAGEERGFTPINERQARFWTERYPTEATVTMGTVMREVRTRDFTAVGIPALFIFSDEDQVVSADAIRDFALGWGGSVTRAPQDLPAQGVDPSAHVIAGDILSPAMTDPVTSLIIDWVGANVL